MRAVSRASQIDVEPGGQRLQRQPSASRQRLAAGDVNKIRADHAGPGEVRGSPEAKLRGANVGVQFHVGGRLSVECIQRRRTPDGAIDGDRSRTR